MNIVGTTEDGWEIVDGVFHFYETHGLPLDVLLEGIFTHLAIPCWITLFKDGVAAGIKPEKWINQIATAVADVGFKENSGYIAEMLRRWNSYERK